MAYVDCLSSYIPVPPTSDSVSALSASSGIPIAIVHPSRNIDPLDAARNRLDNPYQDELHGSVTASRAVNRFEKGTNVNRVVHVCN